MGKTTKRSSPRLKDCHVRIFKEDHATLSALALENGTSWGTELRQLVRRALRDATREITILRETP